MAEQQKDTKEKVEFTKSTAQLDAERRLELDNENPDVHVVQPTNPNHFGEGAYVGTDPIYQNYANDTEKPLAATSGPEKAALDALRAEADSSDEKAQADSKDKAPEKAPAPKQSNS